MPTEPQPKELIEAVKEKTDAVPKKKKYSKEKLKLMQIEEKSLDENAPQHSQSVEGPQFSKIKLKKPSLTPKQEIKTVTLPKFQLKSRIKYIQDWPPEIIKPAVSFLGSVRQNGDLSRNVKEAMKLKKKVLKIPKIPELEKVELEKPEQFDFSTTKPLEYLKPQKALESIEDQGKTPEDIGQEVIDDISDDFVATTEKPETELKESVPIKTDEVQPALTSPDNISDLIDKEKLKPVTSLPETITVEEIKPDLPIEKEDSEMPEEIPKNVIEKPVKLKKKDKPKVTKPMPEKTDEIKPQEKEMVTESKTLEKEPEPKMAPQEEGALPIIVDSTVPKSEENQKVTKPKDDEPLQVLSEQVAETPILTEKDTKLKKKKKIIKPKKDEKLPEVQPVEQTEVIDEPSIPEEIKPKLDEKITPSDDKPDQLPKKDVRPKTTDDDQSKETLVDKKPVKPKPKLTPMKIERKVLTVDSAQHAENTEGPQFAKLKLKKSVPKPKPETQEASLPKFQLKSRITYINDWPPEIIKPPTSFLGSVRQNGILSRNVKEASKIKKKVYKQPDLPEAEKTELEKPMFGHEDIIDAIKQNDFKPEGEEEEERTQEEPEQFTIKPKRPSVKKTEEITEEVTIKKQLKPIRKSSIILPEITEPETVTFRPKSTKTKEDVEQEFNIQLDSYAEEEISMSSKVKLKPQRQPTFSEEANETSIKFYEEEEGPDIEEIIESDVEDTDKTTQVQMSLKKPTKKVTSSEENILSSVTVSRPKTVEEASEMVQDISIKLDRKPKYTIDDQEEVSFDVKPLTEQYSTEEMSLSSKIRLKPKKKVTVSEAADETSIQITQEFEDDNEPEEIIVSEADSEENIEMVIRRKPKKPTYEVSEVEELSVEFKPKLLKDDSYPEEQLTISAKRKPRMPTQLQGIVYTFSTLCGLQKL